MSKYVELDLTPIEAGAVLALLATVVTNADQWADFEPQALGRAWEKLGRAIDAQSRS